MTTALGGAPLGKSALGLWPLGGPNGNLPTVKAFTVPVWTTTAGSGSWTATEDCEAWVFVTGGGAIGGTASSTGGAGAGATFRKYRLLKGQTISYSVAAAATGTFQTSGGNSTATFPDGVTITGQGGQNNVGGVGTGGDINRTGGAGVNNVGTAGNGEFGGQGATSGTATGAGGGAAGFSDFVAWPAGAGATTTQGGFPGGGQGTGVSTGSLGQVVIVAVSVQR